MSIGISTACLYPMQTDEALLHLAKAGVRDVEIFFNAQCETEGELLQSLVDIQKQYGLTVRAVHTYCAFADSALLFRQYQNRLQDGIALYRGLCRACRALSCDLLVLHGDSEYTPDCGKQRLTEPEYVDRFALLRRVVLEEGVRLSQENVVRFRSGQIGQLRLLRDAFGDALHLTMDVKQAVRCGLDPIVFAAEFAPCIAHVHISDHGKGGDCLLPGQGDFSFRTLFSVLQNANYQGDYMIEVYRSAFQNEAELLDSYKYTVNLWSECTNLK